MVRLSGFQLHTWRQASQPSHNVAIACCAHMRKRAASVWLLQMQGTNALVGCLGDAGGGSLHGLSLTPPLHDPRRTPTPGLEQAFVPVAAPAPAPNRPPQQLPPLPLPAMPMPYLPYVQVLDNDSST